MRHPDYPDIEFKPSLALYDKDQTYDLAHMATSLFWIELIDRGEEGYFPFNELQAINSFFGGVPCLFDRHDYTLHPFAKDYSKKLYDKFSKYNNTSNIISYNLNGYNSRQDTGIDYGSYKLNDETFKDYWIHYLENYELYSLNSAGLDSYYTIALEIPAHDYDIYISYYGGRECSHDWLYNSYSYACFDKSVFRIPKSEESKEVIIRFEGVPQVCSIIPYRINENGSFTELENIKNIFNQNSKGWLYENLDSLLNLIDSEIQANFKHLDKGLKSTSTENLSLNQDFREYFDSIISTTNYRLESSPPLTSNSTATLNSINTTFELVDLPIFYNVFCVFRSANNQLIKDNFQLNYDNGDDYYFENISATIKPLFRKKLKFYNLKNDDKNYDLESLDFGFYESNEAVNTYTPELIFPNKYINTNESDTNHYSLSIFSFNNYVHEDLYYRNLNDIRFPIPTKIESLGWFQKNVNLGNTVPDFFFVRVNKKETNNLDILQDNFEGYYTVTSTIYLYLIKLESVDINVIDDEIVFKTNYSKQLLYSTSVSKEFFVIIRNDTIDSGPITETDFFPPFNVNLSQTRDYVTTTFNDSEPQEFFDTSIIYLSETELYNLMTDSQRLKEIHQTLNADKYAWIDNNGTTEPATHSLGWKLEKIAQALGINFSLNGQISSIRQSKEVPRGRNIPSGWYFAQFGTNTCDGLAHDPNDFSGQNGGVIDEERLGIVYQIKSNQIVLDKNDEPIALKQGSYVLCESLPQYLELLQRDLDKAIDWQNLGGGLMTFNGKTQVTEGLFDVLQEISVVGADTNKTTEQNRIAGLITQQLAKEILKAIGLPTEVKKFDFAIESEDPDFIAQMKAKKVTYEVPYNGVAEESPTLVTLFLTLLENIALGNIGTLKLNEIEAQKNQNGKQIEDLNLEVIKKSRVSKIFDNVLAKSKDVIENFVETGVNKYKKP